MACVNRTMSGPLNIHNDHSDSMGARDSGWIQLYSENNQEAYDNMLMANRIGNIRCNAACYGVSGWFYYIPCYREYRAY